MSNAIEVNLLEKELIQYLQDYKEDIDEEVEEVANKVGKEAVAELKQISPKRCEKRILQRLEFKERQNR